MDPYQAVFQRKEVKYLLDSRQLDSLMPILTAHMEPDGYFHSSISNLYYDTPDDRLIHRSLAKPQYKEKLRLRSYGVPTDDSPVFPEIKKKALGIVYKRRVSMPCTAAMDYLSGLGPGGTGQIFHELDWMLSSYPGLAPKVFLSYERDSWKGKDDDGLRLTLDQDILFRTRQLDLRQGTWGERILLPGQTLMEFKIPGAAPIWLAKAFSEIGIFPVSFSKYGKAYERICKQQCNGKEMRQYA